MIYQLLFGQYGFQLHVELPCVIPQHWDKFNADVILASKTLYLLNKNEIPSLDTCKNGWFYVRNGKSSKATYYNNLVPRFSLLFKPDLHSVFINTRNIESDYLLGTQYATLISLIGQSIGLHGVTIICKDQVIILSAPSGTGKTTLAKLLQQYCQAPIVNGDFALLTPDAKEGLIFEPTPFCGSSGICHNYRLKVSRIIFLEQAPKNYWRTLTTREAMAKMLSNVFIPTWDETLTRRVTESVLKTIAMVPIHSFAFAPTPEAAYMLHDLVTQ